MISPGGAIPAGLTAAKPAAHYKGNRPDGRGEGYSPARPTFGQGGGKPAGRPGSGGVGGFGKSSYGEKRSFGGDRPERGSGGYGEKRSFGGDRGNSSVASGVAMVKSVASAATVVPPAAMKSAVLAVSAEATVARSAVLAATGLPAVVMAKSDRFGSDPPTPRYEQKERGAERPAVHRADGAGRTPGLPPQAHLAGPARALRRKAYRAARHPGRAQPQVYQN